MQNSSTLLIRATKILLVAVVIITIGLFFALHLDRYVSFSALKQTAWLRESYSQHPWETIAVYFAFAYAYVVLLLPAATLVMLLAGALFGANVGGAICLLALTSGAVTSLLLSRFVFRDFVRRRFARQLSLVEREYEQSGATYLVSMRLIPLLPYFVTNLVFGLTPIRPLKFFALSFVSSAPGVFIYANAGREISKMNSLSEIVTPRLLLAFAALAALPLVGKLVTRRLLGRRDPANR